MLDCHCHILPGVDDGSDSLEESIAMLHTAKALGLTKIIATPHMKNEPLNWPEVKEAYATLKPLAAGQGIELLLGSELYAPLLTDIGFDDLHQFCIEGTNRMLIEFHPAHLPDNLAAYFEKILSRNIVPILAHPERYGIVQENPAVLKDIVDMGCWLEVNGRSITANPFDKCSNTAKKILKLFPGAFFSSDAHNVKQYEGLAKAEKKYRRLRRDLP